MKQSTLLFGILLTLAFGTMVFAQENDAHLLLNNGTEIDVSIAKVETWGLTLKDDRTVLFKILNELTTRDESLVKQLLNIVDSVHVRTKGDEKILDFTGAQYHDTEKLKGGPIIVRTASLAASVDYSLMYSFQVDVSPRMYDFLVFSAGFATGTTFSGESGCYGVFVGTGGVLDFEHASLLLTINYANRVITPEVSPSEVFDYGFINSELHLFTSPDSRLTFSVGGCLFLSKQGWAGKETWGGLKLGLGIRFF